MSLKKKISAITKGVYPMHMPGHKRNPIFLKNYSALDITEISGADNLHLPKGIIKEAMENTAKLFGAKKTFYLTGGSTAGILSAITALTKKGDTIVVARNCHKSVYNGLKLNSLKGFLVTPKVIKEINSYGEITPDEIKKALNESCAKVVVITSPTYEGIISDIKGISDVCKQYGAKLLVDEAHGAHLKLDRNSPKSAIELGADIVIQSAHKTLPCLTSASLLHICSENIDVNSIAQSLSVFETSSPSYPLLYSLDYMTRIMIREKDALFKAYNKRLEKFYSKAKMFKFLKIFEGANSFAFDKGKISIICKDTNINGFELKELLLRKYKIECEMALQESVLAMTSVADTNKGFRRLFKVLLKIDRKLIKGNRKVSSVPTFNKNVLVDMENGKRSSEELCLAIGHISGEFVYAYPPGCPIIAEGEVITKEALDYAFSLLSLGGEVYSSSGAFPQKISIKNA